MKKMSVLFAVLVVALFMSVGTAVYAEENNTLGTKSYHVELFNEGKIPKIKKHTSGKGSFLFYESFYRDVRVLNFFLIFSSEFLFSFL